VTAPHKARALAAADTVTDEARLVGAANVITFRDGDAYAANTDVGAVISLLRSRKIDPAGQVVTVLARAARRVRPSSHSCKWVSSAS